ncbi:putative cyclin-D7-1 isoform X2 [Arabidopsis lyrata subsp. lyrata]|uniref:putative cyclin-D7-1 isoform X2 n=1 Tax=Arabidopsis lyrata subsp. lyrata TaxID=81972 RepID=UPI000A29D1E1|nr:putative cyclin-D7-1 isoform X2 [Arabidopsis lyrata subsp. lyrata]|eukprot:XP_020876530.1 putative cyclin-D7-1 isoform X2 [Arabidopsis lyrata subsp. lyrata]
MDNLLCEESWPSSPLTPEPLPNFRHSSHDNDVVAMYPEIDAATMEEAIAMDLEKELCFSNYGDKFVEFFVSKKLTDYRFQAVQWLIQTRSRLNLSFETVFSAVNCFDRFVYMTCCDEWTNWMVELVAMELIILKALEWRVNSVTSYSFSQTLVSRIGVVGDYMMMNRITNHLMNDLCDLKILQYPPSVVAAAAMLNVLDEERLKDNIMKLFGQEQKEKIEKCVEVMKNRNSDHQLSIRTSCEGKSILRLLQRGDVMNMNDDYNVESLSKIFQIFRYENKKRDRANHQDNIRPAKRTTFVMSNYI